MNVEIAINSLQISNSNFEHEVATVRQCALYELCYCSLSQVSCLSLYLLLLLCLCFCVFKVPPKTYLSHSLSLSWFDVALRTFIIVCGTLLSLSPSHEFCLFFFLWCCPVPDKRSQENQKKKALHSPWLDTVTHT